MSKMTCIEGRTTTRGAFFISILSVLEVVVHKMGGFLYQYLEEIVGILVLHSQFTTKSSSTMCKKGSSIPILILKNDTDK